MKIRWFAVALLSVAAVAALVSADEVVPFPFWQHGYGCTTFFSIVNAGPTAGEVSIHLMHPWGQEIQATWPATVGSMTAWMPDTGAWDGWYTAGDRLGWGYFDIQSTHDSFYLWVCIYGIIPWGQTGFTVVLPNNPYGVP